jgi:hypothetical protein
MNHIFQFYIHIFNFTNQIFRHLSLIGWWEDAEVVGHMAYQILEKNISFKYNNDNYN